MLGALIVLCKICDKEFVHLAKHLRVHKTNMVEYMQKYYLTFSIKELYESGKSLNFIKDRINSEYDFCKLQKIDISKFLKNAGVHVRETSTAMKAYFKENNVWNKGLTKENHPSILSYSISRLGKNNPIYNLSEEERYNKVYYWRFKPQEELILIRNKIRETLKEGYSSGRIQHISVTDPVKYREIHEKMLDGFRKTKRKIIRTSSHENRVKQCLIDLDIAFETQKKLISSRGYHYDFYLPAQEIIIEVNGNFWHCNSIFYKEDFWNRVKNCYAKEIWEYDADKKLAALKHVKKYVVIWESKIDKCSNNELKCVINEILQNTENYQEYNST